MPKETITAPSPKPENSSNTTRPIIVVEKKPPENVIYILKRPNHLIF
jgi:hypothetical protein